MQKRGEKLDETRSQMWKKEDEVKVEVMAHALMKGNFIS